MKEVNIRSKIKSSFSVWNPKHQQIHFKELPISGSDRVYFRISYDDDSCIAVYNQDIEENKRFLHFHSTLDSFGVNVPDIYFVDSSFEIYFQQDLGSSSLLDTLITARETNNKNSVITLYKKAIDQLIKIQISDVNLFDFNKFQKFPNFDEQAIRWDLNYFKYCFLKPSISHVDEFKLEQDYSKILDFLTCSELHFFMYRDFQARNIMIYDNEPYLIDFQGAKFGPLQYDLVSLLFQAKAQLNSKIRNELMEYYYINISKYIKIDKSSFLKSYAILILLRTLQVLGAYGLKGLFQGKSHFISSIPYAIENLVWWKDKYAADFDLPYLMKMVDELSKLKDYRHTTLSDHKLSINIQSFSYHKGIPKDYSGNGGGFVFDCRFIHNPGRYETYIKLTGRDHQVIEFFKEKTDILDFLAQIKPILDNSVQTYIKRNFSSLSIFFGCTGGQHRSVFSADHIAVYLKNKYDVNVTLFHREQEAKNWNN